MQKMFLVKNEAQLTEINNTLRQSDDWFVTDISKPNINGEWLVVIDDDPDDSD